MTTNTLENKIVVCANNEDRVYDYETFGLTFDSSEAEILSTISPMVRESLGVSLESGGRWLFKTHKTTTNRNTYIIPNSTAG